MKKTKIAALLLFIISFFLFLKAISLLSKRYVAITYKPSPGVEYKDEKETVPVRVSIGRLKLDLPIMPAGIVDGKWEENDSGVSYWSQSPVPGEVGNSVLYAHNWPNLFGSLKKLKVGDEIKVTLSNGEEKIFIVKETYSVTSDQSHILNQTVDTRLTLYTCDGFLDLERFVVIASNSSI